MATHEQEKKRVIAWIRVLRVRDSRGGMKERVSSRGLFAAQSPLPFGACIISMYSSLWLLSGDVISAFIGRSEHGPDSRHRGSRNSRRQLFRFYSRAAALDLRGREGGRPVTIAETLVTYALKPLNKRKAASTICRICPRNPHFGYGDSSVTIGLDRESLKMIRGRDQAAESTLTTELSAGTLH